MTSSSLSIIAIDIDDVLADSTDALRLLVNKRTGAKLTAEQYNVEGEYWGYYERIWQQHGLLDKVRYAEFEKELERDQSHIQLLPGAKFAIHELSKRFHIVLITARAKEKEAATKAWLLSNFGREDVELYFCESHKDTAAKTKGEICRDLGVTLLIDDNVGHCKTALKAGVRAILFGEYGWQTGIPDNLDRCRDWPAVLKYTELI